MNKRILLVDDEQNALNAWKRELRPYMEECDLIFTTDSNNVIDLIAEKKIDLLIIDIIMPQKDGIQIITEALKKYPLLKIIAISGGGLIDGDTYLDIAKELGCSSTLSKPLSKGQLISAIRDVYIHNKIQAKI